MPFLPWASWPVDRRDEIVAGVLVAAVVVVLGYASGIGAPVAGSANGASPPVSSQAPPPAPTPSADPSAAAPPEEAAGGIVPGAQTGSGGALPVTNVPGGGSAHEHGSRSEGHGHSGPSAHPGEPSSPSPSPSESEKCQGGEVHLVQPLLNGVAAPVKRLLDGPFILSAAAPTAYAAPGSEPSARASTPPVCTGLEATPHAQVTP
jgi:hypothetical protein